MGELGIGRGTSPDSPTTVVSCIGERSGEVRMQSATSSERSGVVCIGDGEPIGDAIGSVEGTSVASSEVEGGMERAGALIDDGAGTAKKAGGASPAA